MPGPRPSPQTVRIGKHKLRPKRREAATTKVVAPSEANPLQDYCRAHVTWTRVVGRTEQTALTRERAIKRFIAWADERGLTQPTDITRTVLEAYQRHLYLYRKHDGQPLSLGTQQSLLHPLKIFCRWLTREHHLDSNPASELVLPRMPKKLPRSILSPAQIDTLMAQTDVTGLTGVRDRAMLELLYGSGMRRMELVQLDMADIDLSQGTVMIREGKGRKDRFIPMGERAVYWAERYLIEIRPMLMVEQGDWTLFLTDYGEPFEKNRLSDMVKRYMRLAGFPEGSCHALRHACATHMLENGADIRFIQVLLGHAQLTTTEIYTQVAIGKLKQVHAATHPAGKTKPVQRNADGIHDLDTLLAVIDEEDADECTEAVAADAEKPRR